MCSSMCINICHWRHQQSRRSQSECRRCRTDSHPSLQSMFAGMAVRSGPLRVVLEKIWRAKACHQLSAVSEMHKFPYSFYVATFLLLLTAEEIPLPQSFTFDRSIPLPTQIAPLLWIREHVQEQPVDRTNNHGTTMHTTITDFLVHVGMWVTANPKTRTSRLSLLPRVLPLPK